jgi:branched-chain amino acid transport system substrate-binding protein
VRAPFGTSDFSSFLLQAQQSNASVIAFGTAGADTVNILKQAAEFRLAKPGVRVMPLALMIDEVKAIGLELGQGNFALMAFHHDRSPEAKAWSQRFFERVKSMPTAIQAGTYSAVRHYLQAIKDAGTEEPLTVVAKMRATPVNDMFATSGYLREDGRMVHDMYLTQIKTPAESTDPWDVVKILRTVPGDDAFRPWHRANAPWSNQGDDGSGRSRREEGSLVWRVREGTERAVQVDAAAATGSAGSTRGGRASG